MNSSPPLRTSGLSPASSEKTIRDGDGYSVTSSYMGENNFWDDEIEEMERDINEILGEPEASSQGGKRGGKAKEVKTGTEDGEEEYDMWGQRKLGAWKF